MSAAVNYHLFVIRRASSIDLLDRKLTQVNADVNLTAAQKWACWDAISARLEILRRSPALWLRASVVQNS